MMADDILTLRSEHLRLDIDAGRGADILDLTHLPSSTSVLFSTPWRERAEAVRAGRSPSSASDSFTAWLEQYRGGWQTLCPNAGPERLVEGAKVGFHGEASVVRWEVTDSRAASARLRTELFSVPVVIERDLMLADDAARVCVLDTITNTSACTVSFDFSAHPALGGPFLDGPCTLDTGARLFTADPDTAGNIADPGTSHRWPWVRAGDGSVTDLRQVPPPGTPQLIFGWLSDFTGGHWASVTNADLGLTVRLSWEGTHLPFAWLWQELNASSGFPWFARARVMAIEPASTQTSGPHRASAISLPGNQSIQVPVSLAVLDGRQARQPAGRLAADTTAGSVSASAAGAPASGRWVDGEFDTVVHVSPQARARLARMESAGRPCSPSR
jgi:hypothetical protein